MSDPKEQRELEEIEARLKLLPKGPAKDPRFWDDFARKVRIAHEEAKSRRSFFDWRRFGWWLPAATALFVAVGVGLMLQVNGGLKLERRPRSAPVAMLDVDSDGSFDEDELDELVDEMSPAELERIAAAFETGTNRGG